MLCAFSAVACHHKLPLNDVVVSIVCTEQTYMHIQVTSLYTSKDDGVYGEGEEVALYVVYSHPMDVLGTPTVPLNSGGEASFTLGGRTQVRPVRNKSGHHADDAQKNNICICFVYI